VVGSSRAGARTTAAVAAALTTAVLPVFLIGASTDAIRADLGISETAIGAAVTVLFTAVGLSAAPIGRLTERVGSATALRGGLLLSGLATASIGLLAHAWWQLALPMLVVGGAVGLIDTGGARAFADRITPERQGTAFGLKEASIPTASLLAGLALPTLAVWFGWRGSFLAAPVLAALVAVLVPSTPGHRADASASDTATAPTVPAAPPEVSRSLVRFSIGVGLGAGAATAAATFLVPAGTSRGLSTTAAGALLIVASIASIIGRIGFGRWADREGAIPIRAVAGMLGVGGIGATLLAVPAPTPVAVLGAILLLGAGWGWTGLAFLAAVRVRPEAPAVAAGTVLTGLGVGGALGPLAFGALASTRSYPTAWTGTAAAMVVACGFAASAIRGATAGVDRASTT
jgi:predicted MFS family arabinose efflux permease